MAIVFGYQQMDVLLAHVLKMIDGDTIVVLASALSQQPCLGYEDQGGKAFYRPQSFERLFAFAGVSGYTSVAPVMAHQFHVEFESADAARAGAARLRALRVGDLLALAAECSGNHLFAWCPITTGLDSSARLESQADDVRRTDRFFSIFFKVDGIKSGMIIRRPVLDSAPDRRAPPRRRTGGAGFSCADAPVGAWHRASQTNAPDPLSLSAVYSRERMTA